MQQADRTAQPHQSLRLGAGTIDGIARRLGFGHQRDAMLVKRLADIGERNFARGAVEQAHPQTGFQIVDAPAEAGYLHPEMARSSAVTALLDHFGEQIHIV